MVCLFVRFVVLFYDFELFYRVCPNPNWNTPNKYVKWMLITQPFLEFQFLIFDILTRSRDNRSSNTLLVLLSRASILFDDKSRVLTATRSEKCIFYSKLIVLWILCKGGRCFYFLFVSMSPMVISLYTAN